MQKQLRQIRATIFDIGYSRHDLAKDVGISKTYVDIILAPNTETYPSKDLLGKLEGAVKQMEKKLNGTRKRN